VAATHICGKRERRRQKKAGKVTRVSAARSTKK
jgi:hypothetical protein